MKITITIEDSTPWYAPFSSQEAWLENEKRKREAEQLRANRDIWNASEKIDNLSFPPEIIELFRKRFEAKKQ